MTKRRAFFLFLRDSRDPAADDALLEALSAADEQTAGWIVESLLARGTRLGLRGLIERMHLLGEPHARRLLEEADQLFTVLREAAQSRHEQTWLNVLELIRRGGLFRASYLVESALRQRSAKVREHACLALVGLAERLMGQTPDDPWTNETGRQQLGAEPATIARIESAMEDRHQLASALEAALAAFDAHRQEEVVRAAMWFADDAGMRFWALLSAPGGRVGRVVIKILSNPLCPRLVPFTMAALERGLFRQQVADALSSARDPEFINAWLRQSWRLAQPKVARGMAWVRTPACLEGEAFDPAQFDSDAQRMLGRWLTSTGVPTARKLRLLQDVYEHGPETVRDSVLGALTLWEDPGATLMLRRIAANSPEPSRRIARLELTRRLPNEYPLANLLESLLPGSAGMSASLPEVLEGEIAEAVSFDNYWTAFDSLDGNQRLALGREVLAGSADTPLQLRKRLLAGDSVGKVRALCISRSLDLAGTLEEDICRLFGDARPEVRSAVVAALGKVTSPASRRILYEALSDEDARVRANAVEAIDRMGDCSAACRLLPLLASTDNRERANAVRALLKLGVREAAETLLRMLADDNRAHRASALWLVENLGLLPLAARVARMAASDTDAQVRARAERLAAQLRAKADAPTGRGPHEPQAAEAVTS